MLKRRPLSSRYSSPSVIDTTGKENGDKTTIPTNNSTKSNQEDDSLKSNQQSKSASASSKLPFSRLSSSKSTTSLPSSILSSKDPNTNSHTKTTNTKGVISSVNKLNNNKMDTEPPNEQAPSSHPSSSSSASPTNSDTTQSSRLPAGIKGTTSGSNKHHSLPLPLKPKAPSSTPSSSTSTSSLITSFNSKTASSTRPTSMNLNKSNPSSQFNKLSSTANKPPINKVGSTITSQQQQLQKQTEELMLQIQLQKQQLEQQQRQLEHHQLSQQEFQQQMQLQHQERQLQQQQLEQKHLEQQQLIEHHQKLEMQLQLQQLQHQQLILLQQQLQQPQYSAAARMFISQHPFQPHHSDKTINPSPSDFLQVDMYTAEFEFTPTQAVRAYNEWRDSQWLLPQAFASQLDPLMLVPTYLPFYSFSLITHSVHSGRVGYFKKHADEAEASLSPSEFSSIEYDFEDDRVRSSVFAQYHPDVLVYAPSLELVSTPNYDLMQEIWYWKLSKVQPKSQASVGRTLPLLTRANSSTNLDIKMQRPIPVADAWVYAHQKLVRNEGYCASQILKRECKCDVIENIQTETSFSHIVAKLIYLPVYVWTHSYQGITYHTVMNAQNGLVSGTRPYALKSSFDSCFKLLAGGQLSSKHEILTGVISGAELSKCDNFAVNSTPYRNDKPYLVFPPSDQFLVIVATGYVRLQNLSDTDSVELVAQKRISAYTAGSLVLHPSEVKVIAYRGAWCFCVTSGDPNSILIAYVSTNSGADKEDLMGMV